MSTPKDLLSCLGVAGLAVFLATWLSGMSDPSVRVNKNDIGGVVTSTLGREAGVWVIAETADLPTKYVKIVVTDDQGRFLIPDLPKAKYSIWVRGYGLVDSPQVQVATGKVLNLTAVVAPNERAAAEYYPAAYWFSLLKMPEDSEFPGTGANGNGISPNVKSRQEWLRVMKTGSCWGCHQLGDKATREIPASLGHFDSSVAAWDRRTQSGQAGGGQTTQGAGMTVALTQFGRPKALAMFADWTDRIAAGEIPPVPPRPQGLERNIVVTEWDWATPKEYIHDGVATDRWHPTVNANGPFYGSLEVSADYLTVLDPTHNSASHVKVPVRDPETPTSANDKVVKPSPYWGDEAIWNSQAIVHNVMFDSAARLWLTSRIRPDNNNPTFCKEGSSHPSAKLFPLNSSHRQLAVFNPKSQQFKLINTCFGTHHLNFAQDVNRTLWTSPGTDGQVIGWLNTKMYDETGDEEKSQGWTALILDTNGNGKRDDYVEPDQPIDPKKDKRVALGIYGVIPSPADGSIWGSVLNFPGVIVRLNPGSNPPATALTEIYEPPWNNPKAPVHGYSPRGLDIDSQGVVWTPLASGHLASFDRRKCKGPLNGPTATGQQCPEGWTLYPFPGPQFKGVSDSGSAEASYYTWVDQLNTFGLGKDVPIATGNGNEALLAFANGKFVTLRVPYPMGFYAKGLDGRIDDPKSGWKGRGLWSSWGTRTPFHAEGGKGTTSKVVHFQIRPNPLAN